MMEEYFYSLLLLHKPWRDDSLAAIAHPSSTAEDALLQLRDDPGIVFDEHFSRYDLQEAVRSVRELHNQWLFNAEPQHDDEADQVEGRLKSQYMALDAAANLQQSLSHYQFGIDGPDAYVSNVGVVQPHRQPDNDPTAMYVGDRMTDDEHQHNLSRMSTDQREVLRALHQHVDGSRSGQQLEPLRWFITGAAGVGKSFVISLI